jgi:hypothetical protein
MSTARTPKGPAPDKPLKHLKDEHDAKSHLRRRVKGKDGVEQRTEEQIVGLVRHADTAAALASITSTLYPALPWLMSGSLLSTKIPEQVMEPYITPPQPLPEEFQRLDSYFHASERVIEKLRALVRAEEELAWSFIALRHVCEELGINQKILRGWTGEHQVLAAVAEIAEKNLELKPKLGPKDMEALVQLAGLRPQSIDFMNEPKGLDLRREAWSVEMKKVRKTFLPLLRDFLAGKTSGSGLDVYDPKRHRVRRNRPVKTAKRRKRPASK